MRIFMRISLIHHVAWADRSARHAAIATAAWLTHADRLQAAGAILIAVPPASLNETTTGESFAHDRIAARLVARPNEHQDALPPWRPALGGGIHPVTIRIPSYEYPHTNTGAAIRSGPNSTPTPRRAW
jgi:hypothetical protein